MIDCEYKPIYGEWYGEFADANGVVQWSISECLCGHFIGIEIGDVPLNPVDQLEDANWRQ